jgi:hypothetical protein
MAALPALSVPAIAGLWFLILSGTAPYRTVWYNTDIRGANDAMHRLPVLPTNLVKVRPLPHSNLSYCTVRCCMPSREILRWLHTTRFGREYTPHRCSPVPFTVRPDLDQSAGSTRQLPLLPPGLSPLKAKLCDLVQLYSLHVSLF